MHFRYLLDPVFLFCQLAYLVNWGAGRILAQPAVDSVLSERRCLHSVLDTNHGLRRKVRANCKTWAPTGQAGRGRNEQTQTPSLRPSPTDDPPVHLVPPRSRLP